MNLVLPSTLVFGLGAGAGMKRDYTSPKASIADLFCRSPSFIGSESVNLLKPFVVSSENRYIVLESMGIQ